MDPEAAQVWVQGGRIPRGHTLQVRSITWRASPTSPDDSCYVQLRLGDQQLLREFGFSSPIDGQWSGNLVLSRGSERRSFLEVGPHTQADILIDASLVPE